VVSELVVLQLGIDRRLLLSYILFGFPKLTYAGTAKWGIIKILKGRLDDWDLYLNSVQLDTRSTGLAPTQLF
jgi:hypothetical protein